MNERLRIAKNLLSDDGFIFISIDDNEQAQLKLLCDQIFGDENFVNNISVKMSEATGVKMSHTDKRLPKLKEHLLFYKNSDLNIKINEIKIPKEKWDDEYKILIKGVSDNELEYVKDVINSCNAIDDEIRKADEICKKMIFENVNQTIKNLKSRDEQIDYLYKNSFRILRDVATTGSAKQIADNKRVKNKINGGAFLIKSPKSRIYLIRGDYNINASQPRIKLLFADNYLDVNVGDFWADIKTTGLGSEGNVDFINGKKPLELIKRTIKLSINKNANILDFFAGSGTTGHAVMQLNKEDGGKRKYILCTNNESKICEEVTYKRLQNIQKELPHNLKYFKTDFTPKFTEDEDILSFRLLDHIKEMVELENMCEIDGLNRVIVLTDEELKEKLETIKEGAYLYIPAYILLTNETKKIFEEKKLNLVEIPEYYFMDELREANEI